jgi:rfaE bifunctional protein kinase chain/domain
MILEARKGFLMAKFIVIGDLILDVFLYGDANRISPEAPSILLNITSELKQLGGAYNVVAHLRSLGNEVRYLGITGNNFFSHFDKNNLDEGDEIHTDNRISVIEKTRLVSNYKLTHIARFDREQADEFPWEVQKALLTKLKKQITNVDGVLLVDYNKGLLTKNFIKKIINCCKNNDVEVFVDTKKIDVSLFEGASYLKPNKVEFNKIVNNYSSKDDFIKMAYKITNKLGLKSLVVTSGAEGIHAVTNQQKTFYAPAIPIRINELSGAGDSVLATLAHSLNTGFDLQGAILNAASIAAKFISEGPGYRAKQEDLFFGRKTKHE